MYRTVATIFAVFVLLASLNCARADDKVLARATCR
jgi:hypothetical protein